MEFEEFKKELERLDNNIQKAKMDLSKERRELFNKTEKFFEEKNEAEATLEGEQNPVQQFINEEPGGLKEKRDKTVADMKQGGKEAQKKLEDLKEAKKIAEEEFKKYIEEKKKQVKKEKEDIEYRVKHLRKLRTLMNKYGVKSVEEAEDKRRQILEEIDELKGQKPRFKNQEFWNILMKEKEEQLNEVTLMCEPYTWKDYGQLNKLMDKWNQCDLAEKILNSKDIMTEIAKADRKREEEAKKLAEAEAMAKAEAKAQRDAETKAKLSDGMKKEREAIKAKESQQVEPKEGEPLPEEPAGGESLLEEPAEGEPLPEKSDKGEQLQESKKQESTPSDYFSMPWEQETEQKDNQQKASEEEFSISDYLIMPREQETEQKDNQQTASEEEQTAYEAPEFNPASFFSAPGDLEEKSKSQSEETQTTEEPTISTSEEKRRKEESILLLRDVKITIGRKPKISYKDDDGTHKDEEIDLNYRSLGAIGTDLELVLKEISYAIEKNNEIPDNIKDEIINKLDEKTELIENKKNYEGRQELNFDFDDLSKHSLIDIFRGPSRKIKNKLVETETLLESKGMAAHIGKYEKPKGIFAKIVDVFSRGKNKMIPQSEFKKLLTAGNQSYGRASEDIRGKVRDDEAARRVEEVGRNYSNFEENIIGETERRIKEEESQQE